VSDLATPAPKWCAICLAEAGDLEPDDIDGDGREVLVCGPCREEHPRSGRYAFDEAGASAAPRSVAPRDGNRRGR
jgi:hypothetical protein